MRIIGFIIIGFITCISCTKKAKEYCYACAYATYGYSVDTVSGDTIPWIGDYFIDECGSLEDMNELKAAADSEAPNNPCKPPALKD